MFRNYLKIASRNLIRHSLYFIVNLLGLSLGIACSIIAYANWEFHADFDGGHNSSERIFKINSVRSFEDKAQNYGLTPLPMADFIEAESAHVEETFRYSIFSEIIKLDDKVFNQEVAYADPEFLDVFDFGQQQGSSGFLKELNQVFLTEETALKYYVQDPIGKPLTFVTHSGNEVELFIAGILRDHPLNSSFKFNILMNYDLYLQIYDIKKEDWGQFAHATFLLLNESEDAGEVEKQIQKYIIPFNESREDWIAESFYLVPLNDMANQARYIRGNYLGFNNPEGAIMIPMIMGFVILLVACFNFMNTSISLSEKRLKEIGVRKTLGARRGQLVFQLLSENVIIILLALGLGIVFAEILIPLYSQLGPWIDLKINYVGNISFFGFLIVLMLVTAVLSGAYPAFYITKFNSTNIFSGRFKLKGSGGLSKGLMIVQLGFSLIALIQGIVYVQNTYLQKGFDLGYKKHGVITIPFNMGLNIEAYKEEIKSFAGIDNVAATRHHIGYNLTQSTIELNAHKNVVRVFEVGDNYLETMEIELVEGRSFHKYSKLERNESIVVNEQFIVDFEIESPLDKRVLVDDKTYHVVGVVKDFYPYGLWKSETNHSMLLKLSEPENYQFVVANVMGNLDEADAFLKSKWIDTFSDVPYESDKENMHVSRSELLSGNMAVMNIFLAGITLFLSATGLFTLISINIQKRTKEIGIRKILGASTRQVMNLINKGFVWVLILSVIFGTIMGAWLTEMFLDLMFAVHAHVGVMAVGITAGTLILIVVLTSGIKVFQAAENNPVDALKYE